MPAADQNVSQKAIRTRTVHASHSCRYPNLSLTNAATVVMFPLESTRVVVTSPSWSTTTLYSVQLICKSKDDINFLATPLQNVATFQGTAWATQTKLPGQPSRTISTIQASWAGAAESLQTETCTTTDCRPWLMSPASSRRMPALDHLGCVTHQRLKKAEEQTAAICTVGDSATARKPYIEK